MKKVFYLALACVAMGFASCGNKADQPAADADTVIVDSIQEVADQLEKALDSEDSQVMADAATAAQQKIQELIAAGDTAAAKKYVLKLKEFVDAHSDKLKEIASGDETISNLINTAKTTSVADLAKAATEAAKADANHIAGEAKDAAADKVQETKEVVRDAANQKVEEAKTKVNEKVNEQVDAAKKKANDAVSNAVSSGLKKVGL